MCGFMLHRTIKVKEVWVIINFLFKFYFCGKDFCFNILEL